MLDSSVPLLKIYTLGKFAVYRGDTLIEDSAWNRRKAKNLFKLFLVTPNYQLLKDQILEWLWPNQDPERATNNLHYTLFVLRRILQPNLSKAAASPYILFKDDVVTLNTETIAWIDKDHFERFIRLGHQQNDNLAQYEAARDLYQGDFLPEDLYEDWATPQRESLKKAYSDLLQQMAYLYTQRTAFQEAINCLQEIVALDPTHEEAYQNLMRLYTQVGQRHRALHLYQQACQILHDELSVGPDQETTAVYQAILTGQWQPIPQPISAVPLFKAPVHLLETIQQQPLIGREAEIQQMERILQQLEDGCGAMVVLSGEQGIGKTRLAKELILRVNAAGMQVLYGAAHEQEGHLPYGPFIEAIRGGLNDQTIPLIRERLGVLVNDLARILPELTDVSPPISTQFELEIGQERQRLFDAVAATFVAFTQGSRLVIFLEDIHAAGESSLQLLHYLARRITEVPILILCTVREEAAQRGAPITQFYKKLQNKHLCRNISLLPFNETETSRMCLELLGGGHLDPHLSQTIYHLTGGNPFFIEELVQALRKSGKLEQRNDTWYLPSGSRPAVPASAREVIRLRLEQLSAPAYRLAGLASVIGREVSHRLLRATAQCSDTTLLDLLDELLYTSLIEETEAGYRFHHGLIRQVIYDDLTTHRRAWLHGQVAHALEQLHPHQLDEQAAILVHHFERAGQSEVAFRYRIRAGDWARATYATREALDHYNQALHLRRQYNALFGADTVTDLLERRALTFLALSDFEAAIADLEKLLDLHQEGGDLSRKGEALYQLGIAHYWAHRLAKASTYLNQALQLAQEIDVHNLYAKTLKLRDILDSTQGNVRKEVSDEVLRSADTAHTLPAEEHWGRAMLAHLRSDFETAIHHARACIDLGQSLANTFLTLGGYFVLGMSQASSGDYQRALENLTYALDLSATTEDRFWRARLLNTIGWIHRELFDLQRAIQFDEASLALARIGEPRLTEAEGNALANLATDYLLLEEYDRVRDYLAEGLTPSTDEPFMRWRYHTRMIVIKGRLALVDGDIAGALAAADEALAIARETQARKNISRSCRLRGEAFLAAGEPDRARAALRHALTIGLGLHSPSLIWPCHLTLAQLEANEGNLEAAQSHCFDAAELLFNIANSLTDPALYQPFLAAPLVQKVFANAVCPLPLPVGS